MQQVATGLLDIKNKNTGVSAVISSDVLKDAEVGIHDATRMGKDEIFLE